MIIEIKVPSPGESIQEVEISSWFVKSGDYVNKDQIIAEIDSDKATLEIVSEESGIITLKAKEGDIVKVNQIICLIDTSIQDEYKEYKIENKNKKEEKNIINNNLNNNKEYKLNKKISPIAKKILEEKKISLNSIQIPEESRRILKKDVENVLLNNIVTSNREDVNNVLLNNRVSHREKLSNLRIKISEKLVKVKNETAMLTTFNEIDMSQIIFIKNKYKNNFYQKHNLKLGFMPFFIQASIISLKEYPQINSIIDNNEKIINNFYDINIAISGPKGLVVPIIKNAEKFSFKDLEKEVEYLSLKVHSNKISIDEMISGTFTITNGGVFGSMLSTPIINPPQSAILGMHNIVDRVIVINKKIEIRPIMYLALSYDHRIVDGRESIGFLVMIKKILENPIEFLMNNDIINSLEL